MKKIFWTGLLVGIVLIGVSMVLNPIFGLFMPWLEQAYMAAPFRSMDDPLMFLFFAYPLLLGIGFAYVWQKTKHLFNKSIAQNGFHFGLIYFFVIAVPLFFVNYGSMNLPFGMILSWAIMNLVCGIVAGLILAKVNK